MWLWILATLSAFFVKGLCGFANTLVFTSILGFGANNINISPVELVLGYPSNIIMTVKNRQKLQYKIFLPLVVIVLLGNIPGAFLLKYINMQYVKIGFGVLVVLLSIEIYLREFHNIALKQSKKMLIIIGIVSGVLCGLFGVGALLAAYVSRVTDSSNEFKANISAVFMIENTFRIISYSILGIVTWESVKNAAILVPFMLLGLFLGMRSCRFVNEKLAKKLVVLLLFISGIMLVINNI